MFPNLNIRFFDQHVCEIMDMPELNHDDLKQDLLNLETLNKYFGGKSATEFILNQIKDERTCLRLVLDCACGAGDLTHHLATSLPQAQMIAVDLHPQTLAYAAHHRSSPHLHWQRADIKQLPYPDRSFDLVTCQLALHHFSEEDATWVLRELHRVSRRWVFVTDLTRSRLGYFGVWLITKFWLNHPMTQHDALLSVRRSFSLKEFSDLAVLANWETVQHQSLSWFRQAIWIKKK